MFTKLKQYFRRSNLKSIEQLRDENEKWRKVAIDCNRSIEEAGVIDGKEIYRLEESTVCTSSVRVFLEVPFVVSAYIKLVEPLKEDSKVSLMLADGIGHIELQEILGWEGIERDTPMGVQTDYAPLQKDVTDQLSTEEFRFVEFVFQIPLEKLKELDPWKFSHGVWTPPGIFLENQAVEYHSFYAGIK